MVYRPDNYRTIYNGNDPFLNDHENECGRDLSLVFLSVFFGLACVYLLYANRRLTKQVVQYKKQDQESNQKLQRVVKEADELGRKLLETDKNIGKDADLHSKEVIELKKLLQGYESSTEKLQQQLAQSKLEVDGLKNQLATLQGTKRLLKETKKRENQLSTKISSLEDEKIEYLRAEKQSAQKIHDLQSLIEDHQKTHLDLTEKIEELESLSGEALAKQSYLKGRLKAAQEEITRLEKAKESEGEQAKTVLVKFGLLMNTQTSKHV